MVETAQAPANRVGGQPPVQREYEGSDDDEIQRMIAADADVFIGMKPRFLNKQVTSRRLRGDIIHVSAVWEAPPFAGPGVRLVGTQPEVVWSTVANAKLAIKELRLVKRTFTANKREATGNKTAARSAGDDAGVANYTHQAEAWERGIRAVYAVVRDLDYWLLEQQREQA